MKNELPQVGFEPPRHSTLWTDALSNRAYQGSPADRAKIKHVHVSTCNLGFLKVKMPITCQSPIYNVVSHA